MKRLSLLSFELKLENETSRMKSERRLSSYMMCFSVINVIHGQSAGDYEENIKTHGFIVIKVSTATILGNDKEAV